MTPIMKITRQASQYSCNLIAIMLGRLHMSVDECKVADVKLSERVFVRILRMRK